MGYMANPFNPVIRSVTVTTSRSSFGSVRGFWCRKTSCFPSSWVIGGFPACLGAGWDVVALCWAPPSCWSDRRLLSFRFALAWPKGTNQSAVGARTALPAVLSLPDPAFPRPSEERGKAATNTLQVSQRALSGLCSASFDSLASPSCWVWVAPHNVWGNRILLQWFIRTNL